MDTASADLLLRVIYTIGFLVCAVVTWLYARKRHEDRQDSINHEIDVRMAALSDSLSRVCTRLDAEQTERRQVDASVQVQIGRLEVALASHDARLSAHADELRQWRQDRRSD